MEYHDEQKVYVERLKVRTSKDEYFLDIAMRCANQGTCLRRNYGSVIVDPSGTIISTGYCGAPRKVKDCTEIGWCWREKNNIPSGMDYSHCNSNHSEWNALLQAGKQARGATIYIAGFEVKNGETVEAKPCFICSKMIVNAEIKTIIIRTKNGSISKYDPYEIYELRRKESMDV